MSSLHRRVAHWIFEKLANGEPVTHTPVVPTTPSGPVLEPREAPESAPLASLHAPITDEDREYAFTTLIDGRQELIHKIWKSPKRRQGYKLEQWKHKAAHLETDDEGELLPSHRYPHRVNNDYDSPKQIERGRVMKRKGRSSLVREVKYQHSTDPRASWASQHRRRAGFLHIPTRVWNTGEEEEEEDESTDSDASSSHHPTVGGKRLPDAQQLVEEEEDAEGELSHRPTVGGKWVAGVEYHPTVGGKWVAGKRLPDAQHLVEESEDAEGELTHPYFSVPSSHHPTVGGKRLPGAIPPEDEDGDDELSDASSSHRPMVGGLRIPGYPQPEEEDEAEAEELDDDLIDPQLR